MRSISSGLLAAQKVDGTPYVGVYVYKSGVIDTTFSTNPASSNRIWEIDHIEQPFGSGAKITLRDHDQALKAYNLKGAKVVCNYGYQLADLSWEWWATAPLWVLDQGGNSTFAGDCACELTCIDTFQRLAYIPLVPSSGTSVKGTLEGEFIHGETVNGSPSGAQGKISTFGADWVVINNVGATPFAVGDTITGVSSSAKLKSATSVNDIGAKGAEPSYNGQKTILGILSDIFTPIGIIIDEITEYGTDTSNLRNTISPKGLVIPLNTSSLDVVKQVLAMTRDGIRMSGDGHAKIFYVNTSMTVQETFDFDTAGLHPFRSNLRHRAYPIPNAYCVLSDRTASTVYHGEASDTEAVTAMGLMLQVVIDPTCQSNGDCTNAATRMVERAQLQAQYGEFEVPHNCRTELYDCVQVDDTRSGEIFTGRVGGLRHRYSFLDEVYSLEITLGGLSGGYNNVPPVGPDIVDPVDFPIDNGGNPTGGTPVIDDNTPPSVPTGLTLTTGVLFDPVTGRDQVWLRGEWNPSSDTQSGMSHYIVEYWPTGQAHTQGIVSHPSSGNPFFVLRGALANTLYYAKVAAVDAQLNISGFGTEQSITTAKDTTAPATPTGGAAAGIAMGIRITWNQNTDLDLAEYWLYRTTSTTPPTVPGTPLFKGRANDYTDYDPALNYATNYYYWILAVDTSGNRSSLTSYIGPYQMGQIIDVDIKDDSLYSRLFKGGIQPYTSTVVFSPTAGNKDRVNWASGTIKFADGGQQTMNSGSYDNIGASGCPCGNYPTCANAIHYLYFTIGSTSMGITAVMDVTTSDTKGLLASVYVTQIADEGSDPLIEIGIATFKSKGENILADFIHCNYLSSICADFGNITAGTFTGNSGNGFMWRTSASNPKIQMGYDSPNWVFKMLDASGNLRFYVSTGGTMMVGDEASGQYMKWTGSALQIKGSIQVGSTGFGSFSDNSLDAVNEGSTYKRTTADEKTGAYRGFQGLNSSYQVSRVIAGAGLTNPSTTGIYMAIGPYSTGVIGFYDATHTTWPIAFFYASGVGQMYIGDWNNTKYINWDGSSLNMLGGYVRVYISAFSSKVLTVWQSTVECGWIAGNSTDGMAVVAADGLSVHLAPDEGWGGGDVVCWAGYASGGTYGNLRGVSDARTSLGTTSIRYRRLYLQAVCNWVYAAGGTWQCTDVTQGKQMLGPVGGDNVNAHDIKYNVESSYFNIWADDDDGATQYFRWYTTG